MSESSTHSRDVSSDQSDGASDKHGAPSVDVDLDGPSSGNATPRAGPRVSTPTITSDTTTTSDQLVARTPTSDCSSATASARPLPVNESASLASNDAARTENGVQSPVVAQPPILNIAGPTVPPPLPAKAPAKRPIRSSKFENEKSAKTASHQTAPPCSLRIRPAHTK